MNKLFYGDNLEVLRKYIRDETIDLCYIDPPFNSKRNYNQIYTNTGTEDKAQAQAFIDTWSWNDDSIKGFEEITTNYNGIYTKQTIELIIGLEKVLGKSDLLAYLISMTLRIAEIFRVLKPTGSFYLHCDPTASHYLKLILDSVFYPQGGDFRNEIIWNYQTGGIPQKDFARKHDVIFRYTKSLSYIFNANLVLEPRSEEVLRRIATGVESATRSKGEWRHPSDVFQIASINSMAKERLGYPTQKPEALLERIIKASSNEGDLILDAYCGCGTTVAVAQNLRRNWIGIDITYQSISLIIKRLEDSFGKEALQNIELNGIPQDIKSAIALANKQDDKVRKEFEKWAVLTYSDNRAIINEKKGADSGIDGIAYLVDRDETGAIEKRQVLFSVKSDKNPHVSYIRDFFGAIIREEAAMGYFITLYPPTKPMIDECNKIGLYHNRLIEKDYQKIQIVTVEEILNGSRITIPVTHKIDVVKSAELKEADDTLDFGADS